METQTWYPIRRREPYERLPMKGLRHILSVAMALGISLVTSLPGAQASGQKKILFAAPTSSIEEFRAFAKEAKALGATHIRTGACS
jgi:hypothetical protein